MFDIEVSVRSLICEYYFSFDNDELVEKGLARKPPGHNPLNAFGSSVTLRYPTLP